MHKENAIMLPPTAQAKRFLTKTILMDSENGTDQNNSTMNFAYSPFLKNRLNGMKKPIPDQNGKLDINDKFVKNPANTFFIRVTGKSMCNAGINSGDLLIVDRTITASEGKIVVAAVNEELLVKKYHKNGRGIVLISESDDHEDIRITIEDKLEIWGVVTSVIKTV